MKDSAIDAARRAARAMLEAEIELGDAVNEIGVERFAEIASAIGVRKTVVIRAAERARGLVRSHGELERQVLVERGALSAESVTPRTRASYYAESKERRARQREVA